MDAPRRSPRADSSTATGTAAPLPPGWPEVAAAAVTYVAAFGLVMWLLPMVGDDAIGGIVGLLVSGVMGLLAFGAAWLVRRRGLSAFGIRAARPGQLALGALLGVGAYLVGTVLSVLFILATGFDENVQSTYQAGAAAGALGLVLSILAGALLTPLGEEFAFRGVLTSALLAKLPAGVAIVLGAAVFALAHGINPVLPTAFVVGLVSGVMFHRTGSIWPSVMVHAGNNLVALLVPLVAATLVPAV
ncbi:lysostaphin resistance A-like protein [Brachybacterium sp. AOP43-C2-M15]|uniref:lysostaphin resistance A-like protein n=1 Tax=Brachybacterium sp. AOP43-C2-M15 TaxID=3457661 RepID=UPI004034F2B4